VTEIGRSVTTTGPHGIYADLSTIRGCHELEQELIKLGLIYDYVIFTIGVWPSTTDSYTDDGLHKVFAIDLLARHCVLSTLVRHNLVSDTVRVMSILASSHKLPNSPNNKEALQSLLLDAMRPEGITGLARGFELMFGTAIIAVDIWLQSMQKTLPPNAHVIGTYLPWRTSQ
jgi:hypothetical protein